MSTYERPKTTHEAVLSELRQQLADGRLPPGAAVRPDTIGAELGVSAVPVREALRILEGEGHVSSRPHHGYVVADLDIDDLVQIYRIRELLEEEAVRCALPRLADADVDMLVEVFEEMNAARDDVARLITINRRFNFLLFEASGMPHLVRVLRILWDASDLYRARYLSSREHRDLVRNQYRRILEAIRSGDPEGVNNEMQLHRRQFVHSLSAVGPPVVDGD